MWPVRLSRFIEVPWAEEVLMILFTAVVYIAAHYSLKTARLLPRKKSRKQGKLGADDEVGPAEPRRLARRPAAREQQELFRSAGEASGSWKAANPKSYMEMEGVTDSRFTGVIVCYKPEEGYGFIRCPDLYARFGRDVFLHRLQVGAFDVGHSVSFGVFLNRQGLPQAKDLEPVLQRSSDPSEGSAEPAEAARQALKAVVAPARNRSAKEAEPTSGQKTWASVKAAAQTLTGLWAGDRGATYEVHFYLGSKEGETVGTVLRSRPSDPPKSFPLRWDAAQGRLQLSEHFVLDLDALAENGDTAAWWSGQSRFIWQRVRPNSKHLSWEHWEEDCYGQEEQSQEEEEGWETYGQEWASWAEGGAAAAKGRRGGQPPAQSGAKRWVRKEEEGEGK